MKKLVIFALSMALGGCYGGAEARQSFAQCELDFPAKTSGENPFSSFLVTCMAAHGFILDRNLAEYCAGDVYPPLVASCYRPDNWFAAWLARGRANQDTTRKEP